MISAGHSKRIHETKHNGQQGVDHHPKRNVECTILKKIEMLQYSFQQEHI